MKLIMIGKVLVRSSFTAIPYNLNPKNGKERADVLFYNQCFGSATEIRKEFEDVAKLNKRLLKPSMHIILSASPLDVVDNETFSEIAELLAKEFNFQQSQYLVIRHTDTKSHDHIHICVNRQSVYNQQVVSDSRSYERIARFCRDMELRFNLTKVKSPNRFLSKEERSESTDKRKIQLKNAIKEALKESQNLKQLHDSLAKFNIKAELGRGIKFSDDKITCKGSDLGFSLEKVKSVLKSNLLKEFPNERKEQHIKQINIGL
jgi:hypothetical protein